MQAKLKPVEFIAGKLNVYLRGFQTDQPMVPFMHDVLKDILTSILKMFILSDTIKKADSVLKLLKIDVCDVSIHKPGSSIDIGVLKLLKIDVYDVSIHKPGSSIDIGVGAKLKVVCLRKVHWDDFTKEFVCFFQG